MLVCLPSMSVYHVCLYGNVCLPCMSVYHVCLFTMLVCLPCMSVYHACLSTMYVCLPCLSVYHACISTMLVCLPCLSVYHACLSTTHNKKYHRYSWYIYYNYLYRWFSPTKKTVLLRLQYHDYFYNYYKYSKIIS